MNECKNHLKGIKRSSKDGKSVTNLFVGFPHGRVYK